MVRKVIIFSQNLNKKDSATYFDFTAYVSQ